MPYPGKVGFLWRLHLKSFSATETKMYVVLHVDQYTYILGNEKCIKVPSMTIF